MSLPQFIRFWQRVATGPLGWTPATFWKATYQEVHEASEGKTGNLTDAQTQAAAADARNARAEEQFLAKQERHRLKYGTP